MDVAAPKKAARRVKKAERAWAASHAGGAASGPGSVLRLTHVLPKARLWILGLALAASVAAGVAAYLQSPRSDPLHPPVFTSPVAGLWDDFLHPVERNAVFRLPRLGADLYGVTMLADGRRAWAVGAG